MSDWFQIRSAGTDDGDFLFDMLVEAVNWTPERRLNREAVRRDPSLDRYIEGWPRPGELGLVAETGEQLIGATWLRLFTADAPGYGYLADDIPELSIGVVEVWRNRGVGRALLRELADHASSAGYDAISLSVERANHAQRLYLSEGYRIVRQGADSDTMLKGLVPAP